MLLFRICFIERGNYPYYVSLFNISHPYDRKNRDDFFQKIQGGGGGEFFLVAIYITLRYMLFLELVIVIVLFQITTNNEKEKVRYVKFDRLGHQLITGIANLNTPSSRGTDRYTN